MKFLTTWCFIVMMLLQVVVTGCSSPADPAAKVQPYEHVAEVLGLSNATCHVTETEARISNAQHNFVFHRQKMTAIVDGSLYYLHHPIVKDKIDTRDLEILREAIVKPALLKHRLVVMLDAGHGGKDPGCQYSGMQEKKIVLEVVLEIKRLLEKEGHTVYLSRKDDQFLSLQQRCEMASEKPIDAFVSVHVNASENASAEGVEVYMVPNKGALSVNGTTLPEGPSISQYYLTTSTRLAFAVQRQLLSLEECPVDRGVRHAYFRVVRDTPAPAILAEIGFLSNKKEATRLMQPTYRQAIAKAIANGITEALAVKFNMTTTK